jgi:two-component system response regulator GlrR
MAYDWPGNVRELVDVLERAVLVADGDLVDEHDLVFSDAVSGGRIKVAVSTYRSAKSTFERAYYSRLMRLAGGNVSHAAKLAEKTRKEIYDALKRLRLSPTEYRSGLASGDYEMHFRRDREK